jgi:hypothetical protein
VLCRAVGMDDVVVACGRLAFSLRELVEVVD